LAEQLSRTPLHGTHTSLKAKMVPFAGWDMPVQYTGILAETRAVRSNAGLFDVSHMGRLDISGPDSPAFLDWIVTHHASNLRQGRARYALICNEDGGIIDDTVYYRVAEDRYLLVCNASNRRYVVPWMRRWTEEKYPGVSVEDRTEATAMIAFQGPATPGLLGAAGDVDTSRMRFFSYTEGTVASRPAFVGRTGYTGEDGFELIVDAGDAAHVWQTLMDAQAAPCGLGARDVLRLEAGLTLHGNDIDTTTTPLEAGLERFVRLDKEFVGVDVLRRQKEDGTARRLVGLKVQGRSLARHGYPILHDGSQVGTVTSGTQSPSLDRVVAMGYVLSDLAGAGSPLQIDIRGRLADAEVVSLPFYTREPSA
jgi:aminomethyltransferase